MKTLSPEYQKSLAVLEVRPTMLIYPWTLSATGDWDPKTSLLDLRDLTSQELFRELGNPEVKALALTISAISELIAHGNPRKAASLARLYAKQNPGLKQWFHDQDGTAAELLFEAQLSTLPAEPKEYPPQVRVEYLQ